MNERRFGKTDLRVSEVGLGALEMGCIYGIGEECAQVPSEDEAVELLRAAMECGITLFDSAGVYGLSEYRIGRFLKTTDWRPVLTTKFSVSPSEDGKWLDYATEYPFDKVRECVDHQVMRSLANLGVDTIDVMQYHGLPADDDVFDETLEALRAHVGAGRIRFLGASCNGEQIPRMIDAGCFSTVQLRYNMLKQTERTSGLALAEEHDLGVLVRTSLALGVLAGRVERLDAERRERFGPFLNELAARLPEGMTMPEAALRFVLCSDAVTAPIVGTRRAAHIRQAAKAGDGKGLPAEIARWLYELADNGELPEWTWFEHYEKDWPTGSQEANLELCRSVDIRR